jgi:SdrD B-like protein/flagellar hook capping protein FlgD
LGLSDDKLAMSSQQFSFKSNAYQYQKIRVIDRALAYSGQPVSPVDIVNFPAPPGGDISSLFVTKVGIDLDAGETTIHCLTSRYNGGTTVAYRSLTGTPATPTLSAGSLVSVNTYGPPVNAAQLGSNQLVATNDCRIAAFYVRNGVLTATWHFGVDFGGGTVDAVRLFQLRTSDLVVLRDETFGADGVFYYYPAAIVDAVGTVFIGFDRSSVSDFPSAYASGRRRSDSSIEPSVLLKAGLSATAQSRWGDYTGIDMDETASGPAGSSAWYAGQWTKATNLFGTWVNQLTFTYGRIAGSVYDDCDGTISTTSDRVPVAGAALTLMQGATTIATTTTDGSGAYSFGFLESGAYDVVVTPPAGGVAADAVPGSGGTSQVRASASDISVDLTSSQASSGNLFLVTTNHPVPATAGIALDSAQSGDAAFTLVMNGSNFVSCSTVRLDGSDRPTTYVGPSLLTAVLPASDFASGGTRQITVFTPGPGGGLSNPQSLSANGGPVGVAADPVTLLALEPPAPNPVHGVSSFRFALPSAADVRLSILDLQGRELAVLAAGAYPAGRHAVAWSGMAQGSRSESGLYFVRLSASGRILTRRVVLVR